MTITETQKTAQLAADAAVSAAEAKQYMLEAEQGYQDTSAAAQQAQDAAGSALLSKQSAATSEENSLQYATEAGVARDEAVTAASNASEYALNKFTFYKTPSDPDGTIAGLAATTDGQSFWVAQGPDALSAAWQYQNNAGVAVLQAKQPGTAAITGTIREFPTLAAAQADADAGNISVGSTAYYRSPDDSALAIEVMNVGGTLTTTGRTMASGELVADIDQRISQVDGENITEIHDDTGNIIGYLAADGRLFLPYLSNSVQDILNLLSGLLSSRSGTDIFRFGDGKNDTFIQSSDGKVYIPLLELSVQEEINKLKKNASTSPSIASVDTRNQVGSAAYIVVPEGYLVDQIKWLRDGVVIPGATGHAYVLTSSDMMKKITMTIGSLLGGNRVSDKTAGQIGGIAMESAGPTGSLYEGFTLSAGDDFNALDIITPANPLGRWFTTRTYLNPPRGSDTLLGTMYDTDPAFTGFNDSNRGIPVGFDNMRADGGVLRLQARAATDAEKVYMQGSRHELAAMVSSVGAFSFYAGPAGSGDCIIEWYAMFTHKSQNPAGWHPSLWTQSSLPSYTYNSDEMDIVEGTSQFATSNYNIWEVMAAGREAVHLGLKKIFSTAGITRSLQFSIRARSGFISMMS